MTFVDKHLFALIWGLFFIILALPVLATEPDELIDVLIYNKDKVTESTPVNKHRTAWLDALASRM